MKRFGFWDYKDASIKREILGFKLVKKHATHTLLFLGLPLVQRRRYTTKNIYGGGEEIIDFGVRFCGILCYQTHRYKALATRPSLAASSLLLPTLLADSSPLSNTLSQKLESLTSNMPKASRDLAYSIVSRELQAYHNPLQRCYTLTQDELAALETLAHNFYAKILPLAPNLCYYDGYFLPQSHLECSVFFYKHGLSTLRHLDRLTTKDIIDVGGYIGDSALIFQDYTSRSIHCFEASKSTYQTLLTTLRLNNTTRIIPINNALGAKAETLTLNLYGGGSSLVFATHSLGSEEVEVITLDSYVQAHNIEVGFIKVDIEGFEMAFLQGAKHTICTQKPAMLISIYHQASDFFDIKPLIESWNLGYAFHLYKPIDHHISLETCLFCEIP